MFALARMLTRIPEQVMRFALLFAVDAGHGAIELSDLELAGRVGDYLLATARAVPDLQGTSVDADVERRVLRALGRVQGFATGNQIHRLVGGRIDAARLRRSLDALVALGVVAESKVEIRNHGLVPAYGVPEGALSRGHAVAGP